MQKSKTKTKKRVLLENNYEFGFTENVMKNIKIGAKHLEMNYNVHISFLFFNTFYMF